MRAIALALLGMAAAIAGASPAAAQVGLTQRMSEGMPVTIVYPTSASASEQVFGPFQLMAARDAEPQRGNGRLVVLSHGTCGDTNSNFDLARTLAQSGFIVAQPEHRGDNWRDCARAGPDAWKRRPTEVTETIDLIAKDAVLAPLLRLDKISVYGMSAGGVTGLALAGGQWSIRTLARHCATSRPADGVFCYYGASSWFTRMTRTIGFRLAGLASEAAGHADGAAAQSAQLPDPRIAAVALAVPAVAMFKPETLAAIRIPVGVVSAAQDELLVPRFHSEMLLKLCQACKPIDRLDSAGHFDLLSPWPQPLAERFAQTPGGARSPSMTDVRRD